MKKFIYTDKNGVLWVREAMPKSKIEKNRGTTLTDEEYETLILSKSIPKDSTGFRYIDDSDIPPSREFRNQWTDVTQESHIDIDCEKVRDDVLQELRTKRHKAVKELEQEMNRYSHPINQTELDRLYAERQSMLDITEPLKALKTKNKFNDETLLDKIRTERRKL